MTSMTARRRLVISTLALLFASAVVAMLLLAEPMSSAMPGMDHGSGVTPVTSPSTAMPDDMAGMDHGSGEATKGSPTPTPTPTAGSGGMAEDMPGMDMPGGSKAPEAVVDRPLAPVLGTFGGGTAVVLVAAAVVRGRDQAKARVKEAARAARRAQK